MADDNNTRNRLNNMSDRGSQSGGQSTDPLAELARLIGQNDPYSEFGRDTRALTPAPQRPMPDEQPLGGRSYLEARAHTNTAGAYHIGPEPPAFIQAGRDANSYNETVYRDVNSIPPEGSFYDEPETGGRSHGFKMAIAAIVLAVIGTAGAFGYRIIFSGSSSSAPPPVIRANPDPTKVAPPVASGESSQSKAAYDRVGDRGQGERVISREEPPVDARDLRRQGASQNPPPPTNSANQWSSAVVPNLPPTASNLSASVPPAVTTSEPRRVRTVPIRPESTETSIPSPALTPPGASATTAITPNARSASVTANPPVQALNQPRQPTVASAPTQTFTQAPANAPLTLNDDSTLVLPRTLNAPPSAPQARQAPTQRQATPQQLSPPQQQVTAPRQPPQAPTQLAATTQQAGGYLVQVSSQRNEAEAQAALRSVQGKFPIVLRGQQATVRRADLGERGVFYRAMIGPFASRDQATQLCGSLKAAGGDCIVQGN